jgi:hypothetical protein
LGLNGASRTHSPIDPWRAALPLARMGWLLGKTAAAYTTHDNPAIATQRAATALISAVELQSPSVTGIVWQTGNVQRSIVTNVKVSFSDPGVQLNANSFDWC